MSHQVGIGASESTEQRVTRAEAQLDSFTKFAEDLRANCPEYQLAIEIERLAGGMKKKSESGCLSLSFS